MPRVNGAAHQQRTVNLIRQFPPETIVLPVQVLGELFNVLVRKAGWRPARARAAVMGWLDGYSLTETSSGVLATAMDLSATHGLSTWDAVVLAASADAKCRLLTSEHLHDGFTWNGVTVTNPYADSRHPFLSRLLIGPVT